MKRNVLLVEDERELRELWCELLSANGCSVTVAETVGQARQALLGRDTPFDLALVDWTLPDGLGSEVIGLGRGLGGFRASVVTSGLGNRLPAGHGADAVLAKPFRVQDLLDLMERLCPTAT